MSDTNKDDFRPEDFEQVTTEIYSWKDKPEGHYLIGTLMDIQPFEGGKFDTIVNQYILDTKDGLVSTVLGSATDTQLKNVVKKGDRLYIEYHGKQDLEDGRSVNKFRVLKAKNAK